MKVTVDIPERELKEIQRFAGEKKKGPAIRKFLTSHLMLERRHEMSKKVLSGEISAEIRLHRKPRDYGVW